MDALAETGVSLALMASSAFRIAGRVEPSFLGGDWADDDEELGDFFFFE